MTALQTSRLEYISSVASVVSFNTNPGFTRWAVWPLTGLPLPNHRVVGVAMRIHVQVSMNTLEKNISFVGHSVDPAGEVKYCILAIFYRPCGVPGNGVIKMLSYSTHIELWNETHIDIKVAHINFDPFFWAPKALIKWSPFPR